MLKTRIIPVLLLRENIIYKSKKFKNHRYIGDPLNTLKIFNEKEVDEIVILDTTATINQKSPNFELIKLLASECFMPLAYGGGITNLNEIENIFKLGVEKVILNTSIINNPQVVKDAMKEFGSQSIVASIDVGKNIFNKKRIFIKSGKKITNFKPVDYAKYVEDLGVGEIILNAIYRDGIMGGYDIELIKSIVDVVTIPVVALGGAGNINHLKEVINSCQISGLAAGSMFIYHGVNKAILINMPDREFLEAELF